MRESHRFARGGGGLVGAWQMQQRECLGQLLLAPRTNGRRVLGRYGRERAESSFKLFELGSFKTSPTLARARLV